MTTTVSIDKALPPVDEFENEVTIKVTVVFAPSYKSANAVQNIRTHTLSVWGTASTGEAKLLTLKVSGQVV
jgi:hypothetical protein